MQPPQPPNIDPAVPTLIPDDQLHDFTPFLQQVHDAIVTAAAGPIMQTGLALWSGFAAVVIVWKGLQIAYSGTFHPWDLIRAVVGLWIPWLMLQYYATPIPNVVDGSGNPLTFPGAIVAGVVVNAAACSSPLSRDAEPGRDALGTQAAVTAGTPAIFSMPSRNARSYSGPWASVAEVHP